jgi:DNA-binding LytR/AlgR family response regulator
MGEIWAFEAAERLTFVHSRHGTFDIDVSLAAIETSAGAGFARVHRNWLVNRGQIKTLERSAGNTILFVGIAVGQEGLGIQVPVARTRATSLRQELLANAIGVRR